MNQEPFKCQLTPSHLEIGCGYIQIHRPYMTLEAIKSFIFDLEQRINEPNYVPSAADVWLVNTLSLEESTLPKSLQDVLSMAVTRPKEVDDMIATTYKLVDQEEFILAKELLEQISDNDSDSVTIRSLITFLEPR